MTDCVASLNSMAASATLAAQVEQAPEQGMLNGGIFYDYYMTQDGRYLSIGSLEPQFMAGLSAALDLPVLLQKGASLDVQDRQDVKQAIQEKIKAKTFKEWHEIFANLDVCVEPVLSLSEALNSPLAQQRGWIVNVPLQNNTPDTEPQIANIFSVLEKIGLNAQKRAIHVQFSNELLNNQIFLQRIEGQHQLNGGLMAELICLSTNAQIALKQFIGVQVAVDQVTDSGQLFRTTGIVTEASYGQSDGALTLYKLTIEDATNLWHKRRNSRVFMNKSIVEITEVLFKEWQEKSPLFAASLSLDLGGLSQNYDIRPFTMQHNESDYDFLTRLWRSEGISWLIDESELFVPHFT
ncbi:contractile injection system protein, VgrG/Pvc8 family, partial [Acinetobacter baumannii]